MTKQEFRDFLKDRIVFLDGATGSNLFKAGMPAGVCPEKWILEHKEVLFDLQKRYAEAGSNIVYAPTFTGNSIKLADYGLEDRLEEINTELVKLSKSAVGSSVLVAGDVTMTGKQLKPVGDLDFEDLINVYKQQIEVLDRAGADLIVIETMMSLQECRAAVLAANEVTSLPIMVTLTFESDGRTLYGTDAASAAICLEALGVDAIGANCSTGPDKMSEIIKAMATVTNIPIIAKPNAGLPSVGADGSTEYDMGPEEFTTGIGELIRSGASIVGGCCGSTPVYIRMIHEAYGNKCLKDVSYNVYNDGKRKNVNARYLSSERSHLIFGMDDPFMIVGERINPTGKKALQAQLREGNLDMV